MSLTFALMMGLLGASTAELARFSRAIPATFPQVKEMVQSPAFILGVTTRIAVGGLVAFAFSAFGVVCSGFAAYAFGIAGPVIAFDRLLASVLPALDTRRGRTRPAPTVTAPQSAPASGLPPPGVAAVDASLDGEP